MNAGELLVAEYRLTVPTEKGTPSSLDKLAEKIAIGQTIGTFQAKDMQALNDYQAQVISVEPEASETGPTVSALIKVGFPLKAVESDLGTLITVVFGKLSMAGKIRLMDLHVSPALVQRFGGPRFGIIGIREQLGVLNGPLLMTIFKPCMGVKPDRLGDMLYQSGLGGVHLAKDDEVISDPQFETALERLAACKSAQQKVYQETGRKVSYAINLSGPAETLLDRARQLKAAGADMLLFNMLPYGYPMLQALRQDSDINLPIMAHPALGGAFYGSTLHGVSPRVLFGVLPRLAGADLMLFPSPYGAVALEKEDALAVGYALTQPVTGLKPAFPVPSAGITHQMCKDLLADFGPDLVINAGTGIHDHPDGTQAGATQFVKALSQCMQTPLLGGVR